MKGDHEMPGSHVFKKPTYLNTHRSIDTSTIHWVIQWEPGIVNNSLSGRKVFITISFVVGCRIMSLLRADLPCYIFIDNSIPVLVKGLENSCCRSLSSDVLRTTTMSTGRVSLFFSRKPSTLYITCRVGHKAHTKCRLHFKMPIWFVTFAEKTLTFSDIN